MARQCDVPVSIVNQAVEKRRKEYESRCSDSGTYTRNPRESNQCKCRYTLHYEAGKNPPPEVLERVGKEKRHVLEWNCHERNRIRIDDRFAESLPEVWIRTDRPLEYRCLAKELPPQIVRCRVAPKEPSNIRRIQDSWVDDNEESD